VWRLAWLTFSVFLGTADFKIGQVNALGDSSFSAIKEWAKGIPDGCVGVTAAARPPLALRTFDLGILSHAGAGAFRMVTPAAVNV
jgi:hypothetical protein